MLWNMLFDRWAFSMKCIAYNWWWISIFYSRKLWLWISQVVAGWSIIGSDNGLAPDRHQAIIWTNAGILSSEPLGTNFSEILIKIHIFSFKKMHLQMSSGKWRPFCLGLSVLNHMFTKWGLTLTGLILGLHPANERKCYIVTTSLIGWRQG